MIKDNWGYISDFAPSPTCMTCRQIAVLPCSSSYLQRVVVRRGRRTTWRRKRRRCGLLVDVQSLCDWWRWWRSVRGLTVMWRWATSLGRDGAAHVHTPPRHATIVRDSTWYKHRITPAELLHTCQPTVLSAPVARRCDSAALAVASITSNSSR